MLFTLCVLVSGMATVYADTAPVSSLTEATDVYWYVQGNNLILSNEQGNSGLQKWNKEDIASVDAANDIPWHTSRASIKKILFYGPIAPTSTAYWFQDTELAEFSASVDGTLYFDMSFTTNAIKMFAGCTELTTLDLTGVSAPLVTNIESAFDSCAKITSLDISCFDGAPITDMMNVFYGCSLLTSLDVSGLDISRVTDFTGVFWGCAKLTSLDLSALDARNITMLDNSFNGCEELTSITFRSKFTCEKVTSMRSTFMKCKKLTTLDISNFHTSKVTDMTETFNSCELLEEIKFGSGFKCTSVQTMERTFAYCKALRSLDTSGWEISNVKNMNRTFYYCSSLQSLNLLGFLNAAPTNITALFAYCSGLKNIDTSPLNTSNVTSFYNLFNNCSSLESFDFAVISSSSVTDMSLMFGDCTSLTYVSLVGADTSKVTTMYSMFKGCKSLVRVNLTGIDTGKVTDISDMFSGCTSLKRLDLSDFDISEELTSSYGFVKNCRSLEMIVAPDSIPEAVTVSLGDLTFFTGTNEISSLTSENQGAALVRKFSISYYWKNGTSATQYTLSPNYYYYNTSTVTIDQVISSDGYVFGGWTRSDSDELVTQITTADTGNISLYAKMTPIPVIRPVISESDAVIITYGEGIEVNISFIEQDLHTYTIEWYYVYTSINSSGKQIPDLRNTRGFTVEPFRFKYGIEIDKKTFFYCVVTAKRADNGLTETVASFPIMVLVNRAQAEITVHPTVVEGLIYNGSAQAVTAGGETNYGDHLGIVFSFYPFHTFSGNNKVTKAGTGTVYYKTEANQYFIDSPTYSLTYTIEGATPTISWSEESQTLDYTGNAASIVSPTVTLLNSDVYSGTVEYSYTGTSSGIGIPVNAGTYVITASIKAEENYKAAVSSNTLTLTINKVASAFSALPTAIDGLIYSKSDTALINAGVTADGTVEYSLDNSVWSASLPTAINAGEYRVYYRIVGDANHLDGASGYLTSVIGKRNITVNADDKIACADTTVPQLTYTVSGICAGDSLVTTPTLTTDAEISTLGEYTITVSGVSEEDNYIISYVGGTLLVTNHSWDGGKITTAPTCSDKGILTYTCAHDLSHTKTDDVSIDVNAHIWNDGNVTVAPTCTENGVKTMR